MKQIDIMPKREGSGELGTQELLSVGTPLLAALNLTPIGRGIMGAVATMATIPEESEAGVFGILPKLARRGRVSLVEDGAAVFPDMTRNVEFPTHRMSNFIDKKGRTNLSTLADAIHMPPMLDNIVEEEFVMGMYSQLKQIPTFARNEAKMMKTSGITENTNAFFMHPNPRNNLPFGKIAVKYEKGDGTLVDTVQMAASATHEFTHGADMLNPTITKILSENNNALDYNFNLGESRAFISGSRQGMDKTITSPDSPDFLHPMLSYGGGKIAVTPGLDFINNLRHSYKAIGKQVDEQYVDDYLQTLREERIRMQIKVDNDPKLRYKYDVATQDISPSNQQWVFDNPQKAAHTFRQEQLTKARANLAKKRQAEIDAFNKSGKGETYTEPGYNAATSSNKPDIFSEKTGLGDYDAFYNPTSDFGTYNNVVKKVVNMKPQDYIDRVVKGFVGSGYKEADVLARTEPRKLEALKEAIDKGATLPHPSLRYAYTKGGEDTFSQEGWHRAMLAKELGIEEMPVSVIYNDIKGM